jgi:hypothetical protein
LYACSGMFDIDEFVEAIEDRCQNE